MKKFLSVIGLCLVGCSPASDKADDGDGGSALDAGFSPDVGGGLDAGDGGLGADSALDPDAACLSSKTGATAKPANLLFQLDVSGSMNCPATDTASATCAASTSSRWSVFKAKLKEALAKLPDANSVGLMHYPTGKGTFSGSPTGCVPQVPDVDVGPLSKTRTAVGTALDARIPEGGTPTHDAIGVALANLEKLSVTGNKFLVLATDGNATFCTGCDISCNSAALAADADAVIAKVAAAAKAGIRTFVIGVPGSQGYRTILSRIAKAGGTAPAGCSDTGPTYCHYDMTTAADFGAAMSATLASIGGAALSCTYDIPKKDGSFDPTKVNVRLTSGGKDSDIARDPTRKDGWDYSDDGNQIILYGPACEAAKGAIDGACTILYGCPTVIR